MSPKLKKAKNIAANLQVFTLGWFHLSRDITTSLMPGSESGFVPVKSERTCSGLDRFAPTLGGRDCISGGVAADRSNLGSILTIVRSNDVANGQSEAL